MSTNGETTGNGAPPVSATGPATAAIPPPASAASRPVASLRLPPFSTEETELWLSQVECALGVAGITDDLTRYQVLVVNLPTEVAVQVRDVISSPAPSYATLTAALRERLAQSRASRLEALLRHQQLGDQRPSELLRRMQGELAMAGVLPADNGLLRTLYKQRLPQSARAALSLLPEDIPLPELAAAADRFMEANTPALSVSAVHQAPQPPNQSALDQLTASVAALTAAIGQMQTDVTSLRQGNYGQQDQQHRYRGRSNSRHSRARSPSQRRGQQQQLNQLCFYHHRFGAAARKCSEPCSWTPAQQENGQA
ncbi:uncharacterized protein LOC122366003 [Amphibalanus amphitrite]|uniref:uncharacterized protein LOC122366003 n=1 Tax=Amphibalanus amphitrite TaxID=1232801 RepID=UPI001C92015A|nr:uncharacterized protein LOC122366003 [Amphibalanus amphitrite]